MKSFITLFTLSLLMTATTCFSQTSQSSGQTKALEFSSQTGLLIEKEFVEIGSFKKTKIQVIRYTDMASDASVSSLKISFDVKGSYATDTKVASLDEDEIDAVVQSIELMQQKVFGTTPENYTEVTFRSRGGFEAGCYWSKDKWLTYIKLEENDNDSYLFLTVDEFPELVAILKKAKAQL